MGWMTTPAGFIPSPLDHATPPQGQAVQAAGPVGPTAIGHSPSAAAPWPRPNSAPLTAAAGQASSAAGPAAPLQMNGVDANIQPATRPLTAQANGRGVLLRAAWQCNCDPLEAYLLHLSLSMIELLHSAGLAHISLNDFVHGAQTCSTALGLEVVCVPAEFGIAPTTPGRGSQLSPPFKLVAPNSDMKEIPATFVVSTSITLQ